MFKTRLLSGIVLLVFLVGMLFIGGSFLLVSLLVIALIGLYEFYRVFHIEATLMGFVGYLTTILYFMNLKFEFFI